MKFKKQILIETPKQTLIVAFRQQHSGLFACKYLDNDEKIQMFDDLSHLATINVTSTYLRRKKNWEKNLIKTQQILNLALVLLQLVFNNVSVDVIIRLRFEWKFHSWIHKRNVKWSLDVACLQNERSWLCTSTATYVDTRFNEIIEKLIWKVILWVGAKLVHRTTRNVWNYFANWIWNRMFGFIYANNRNHIQ